MDEERVVMGVLQTSWKSVLAIPALALLALSGCAAEESESATEEPAAAEPDSSSDSNENDTAKRVSGTIDIDGEVFEVNEGRCGIVAGDNEFRVAAFLDDGYAEFDEPEYGMNDLDDGREYGISRNDDGPNIVVTAQGVTGDSYGCLADSDGETFPVTVELECHYE